MDYYTYGFGGPPPASIWSGMSTAALQALLEQAQAALGQLMAGNKPNNISISQGDGSRSVNFTPTNTANAIALIRSLQKELGIVPAARRPVRFNFR